jgi:CRISP-associated protein Cas1
MNLFLFDSGELTRSNNTLCLINDDKHSSQAFPVRMISNIFLMAPVRVDSGVVGLCHDFGINLYFFDNTEDVSGILTNALWVPGMTLKNQILAYEGAKRTSIAREILLSTAANIGKVLSYYSSDSLLEKKKKIAKQAEWIEGGQDVPELMKREALMWKIYYSGFSEILKLPYPFERIQKKPKDSVNLLLNYLNAVLYRLCLSYLLNAGLSPAISYLHSTNDRPISLPFDMAEMYKPLLVERTIFTLVNRHEVSSDDSESSGERTILTSRIRHLAIETFMEKLKSKMTDGKYYFSYEDFLKKDCYALRRFIDGKTRRLRFYRSAW